MRETYSSFGITHYFSRDGRDPCMYITYLSDFGECLLQSLVADKHLEISIHRRKAL